MKNAQSAATRIAQACALLLAMAGKSRAGDPPCYEYRLPPLDQVFEFRYPPEEMDVFRVHDPLGAIRPSFEVVSPYVTARTCPHIGPGGKLSISYFEPSANPKNKTPRFDILLSADDVAKYLPYDTKSSMEKDPSYFPPVREVQSMAAVSRKARFSRCYRADGAEACFHFIGKRLDEQKSLTYYDASSANAKTPYAPLSRQELKGMGLILKGGYNDFFADWDISVYNSTKKRTYRFDYDQNDPRNLIRDIKEWLQSQSGSLEKAGDAAEITATQLEATGL